MKKLFLLFVSFFVTQMCPASGADSVGIVFHNLVRPVDSSESFSVVAEITNKGIHEISFVDGHVSVEYFAVEKPVIRATTRPVLGAEFRLLVDLGPSYKSKIFLKSVSGGEVRSQKLVKIFPGKSHRFKVRLPSYLSKWKTPVKVFFRIHIGDELVADSASIDVSGLQG